MPRSGAVTPSDLIAPTLTLVCALCDRRGVYSVARLQSRHVLFGRINLRRNCPSRAEIFSDPWFRFFDRAKSNIGWCEPRPSCGRRRTRKRRKCSPLDDTIGAKNLRGVDFEGPIGGREDSGIAGVGNAALRLGGSPVGAGFCCWAASCAERGP
jgi:hypothetical protein